MRKTEAWGSWVTDQGTKREFWWSGRAGPRSPGPLPRAPFLSWTLGSHLGLWFIQALCEQLRNWGSACVRHHLHTWLRTPPQPLALSMAETPLPLYRRGNWGLERSHDLLRSWTLCLVLTPSMYPLRRKLRPPKHYDWSRPNGLGPDASRMWGEDSKEKD